MLIIFIMLQQLISPKIIFQIPDHSVNMIGIVLCIVIFNDNCWALYAVIMRMTDTRLLISRPGKPEIIKTCCFNLFHHTLSKQSCITMNINTEYLQEYLLLRAL